MVTVVDTKQCRTCGEPIRPKQGGWVHVDRRTKHGHGANAPRLSPDKALYRCRRDAEAQLKHMNDIGKIETGRPIRQLRTQPGRSTGESDELLGDRYGEGACRNAGALFRAAV